MRMSNRVSRTLRTLSLSALILGLAACAAPTPNGGTQASDEAAPAKSATASADAASSSPRTASAQAEQASGGKQMRTGGPLPADPIEHASGSGTAGAVDFSCQSDADCAVKNVGSCCGYHPGCVNKNSPTDPEGVKAQCARQGMSSVCGFQDISSCSCKQGRCEAGGGQLR